MVEILSAEFFNSLGCLLAVVVACSGLGLLVGRIKHKPDQRLALGAMLVGAVLGAIVWVMLDGFLIRVIKPETVFLDTNYKIVRQFPTGQPIWRTEKYADSKGYSYTGWSQSVDRQFQFERPNKSIGTIEIDVTVSRAEDPQLAADQYKWERQKDEAVCDFASDVIGETVSTLPSLPQAINDNTLCLAISASLSKRLPPFVTCKVTVLKPF